MEILSAACCIIPLYYTPKSLSLHIHVTSVYVVPIPLYRYHGSARIMGRRSDVASGASHIATRNFDHSCVQSLKPIQHYITSSILFFFANKILVATGNEGKTHSMFPVSPIIELYSQQCTSEIYPISNTFLML